MPSAELVLAAELACVGLATWAMWRTIPRPPSLDWERLFKVTLSVLAWGDAEREHSAAAEAHWLEALKQRVPYHPAARDLEHLLTRPDPARIQAPALPHERALVEALVGLDSIEARWDRVFCSDVALDALGDPRDLGAAYDPTPVLGPSADWVAVGAAHPAVDAGLARRFEHIVHVRIGAPAVPLAGEAVAGLRDAQVDVPTIEALSVVLSARSDRLVLWTSGEQLVPTLEVLLEQPALIDVVVAILVVGGPAVCSDSAREFFTTRWRHEAFAPELQRTTPVFSVRDLSAATVADHDWSRGVVPPPPPEPGGGRDTLQCIDLGPLPVARTPPVHLCRALLITLAFRLAG